MCKTKLNRYNRNVNLKNLEKLNKDKKVNWFHVCLKKKMEKKILNLQKAQDINVY